MTNLRMMVLAVMGLFVVGLTACGEDYGNGNGNGAFEETGETIEEGAEETGEAVEEGVEDTQDAFD